MRLAVALLLAAGVTQPVRGQVCAGFPSLRTSAVRLGVAGASYSYATALGVSVAVGDDIYSELALGRTRDEVLDAETYDTRLTIGADVPVSAARRVFICPSITAAVSLGPYNFLLDEGDYRYVEGGMGLGLAALAVRIGHLLIAPYGAARIVRLTAMRIPSPAERRANVPFLIHTDVYWLLNAGVGLTVGDALTVRPEITVPLGLIPPGAMSSYAVPFGREEGEISFDISVGISFGSRRRPAGGTRLQP